MVNSILLKDNISLSDGRFIFNMKNLSILKYKVFN